MPCAPFLASLFLLATAATAQDQAIPKPEHPDPMAVRRAWTNLNGAWDFRFDATDEGVKGEWFAPGADGFDRTITVPFPWESKLSGIADTSGDAKVGWYRRTFTVPTSFPRSQRVWLRFGAVDWHADAWVNGQKVAEHDGGYTPFAADVTDALKEDGDNVLVVRAFDPTDPGLPTGKQVGWYTPSSGIWQTVWLEARPAAHIGDFFTTTEIDPAQATIEVTVAGPLPEGGLKASVRADDPTVGGAEAQVDADGKAKLVVPVRDAKIWYPEVPYLYEITLELRNVDDRVVDSVATYFALRTITRGTYGDEPFERILLNGRPQYIRAALDQSFNPDGLYTAPDDEFLKRDVALAKLAGLNCLRIHIKPEEPRKLYWADRTGLMIMQDMPNTWEQDAEARAAWESTMREAIARDKNHPSIWAWVAFNETWGLGEPDDYKKDADTQGWVARMVGAIKELDPTRLVEDNSPCNYDHVETTDINSWHFYIDDHEDAKAHIADVVAKTEPGSTFNYCPGSAQSSAPLINSEYGSVSAGGGDRDVSWGFRDLTTQIRKHNKIQGYVYTELTDIEWEHNGFFNYDRSPKDFGYEAFLPDMWINELNGPDFVGYDAPPAIVGRPGETIEVPIFISHYSVRDFEPKLRWWLQGWDDRGDEVMASRPQTIPAKWDPYQVTWQEPIRVKLPDTPFVGALIVTLRDPTNRDIRFCANYVNVVVRPEQPQPRVTRRNDQDTILRFAPEDYSDSEWTEPAEAPPGKVYGRGKGYFEYTVQVPDSILKADPDYILLRFEASPKAGRQRVDWPERENPQDYPQTDPRESPTTIQVEVNGQPVLRDELAIDGGDARGVLSHVAGVEHGSHGELITVGGDIPQELKDELLAGMPLTIRIGVPDDAQSPGGLAIYGAITGQYPMDLAVEVHTANKLPDELVADPNAPVAINRAAARRVTLLPTGDAGDEAAEWSYTTDEPPAAWTSADFDDSSWQKGKAGFGTDGTPGIRVHTRWDTPAVWLRTKLNLPEIGAADVLTLRVYHDEDVRVLVNGQELFAADGYVTGHREIRLTDAQKALFQPGENVIAVSCTQSGGGQGIDVGLRTLKAD